MVAREGVLLDLVHCRDIPTFWAFFAQKVGISLQSALPVTAQTANPGKQPAANLTATPDTCILTPTRQATTNLATAQPRHGYRRQGSPKESRVSTQKLEQATNDHRPKPPNPKPTSASKLTPPSATQPNSSPLVGATNPAQQLRVGATNPAQQLRVGATNPARQPTQVVSQHLA